MILIYSLLYTIAFVCILPFEYFKRPKELRWKWLSQKFGNVGRVQKSIGPTIWIHAVSVGETLAAIPLIGKLREQGYTSIILSTITDTGQQIAAEKKPEGVKTIYLPFDLKIFLKKAIHLLSPDIFMTMETEIWPNLFKVMEDENIPAFILNGRISDRSFPRYRKIRFFLKKVFSAVKAVGMQTAQDAARIREMGIDDAKIHIIGNFKFDIQGNLKAPEWLKLIKGINIVAGSTHEGEEALVMDAYLRLKKRFVSLNLILAPRHPQRFTHVESLLREKGVSYIKRSSLEIETSTTPDVRYSVILIDTIGELAGIYSVADICIIGGSFVPIGGHNLFEAAYWSKPIICGPHMNNFPLVTEFQRLQAVRIIQKNELYDNLLKLLESSDSRLEMGRKANTVFSEHRGAVEKALRIVKPYIESERR